MPGIIGVVSPEPAIIDAHYDEHLCGETHLIHKEDMACPGARLYYHNRASETDGVSFAKEDAYSVLVYGHCFSISENIKCDAQLILKRYRREQTRFIADMDGAFHIVILDSEKSELFLINDRLGILPLYLRATEDSFTFAPKLRYLRPVTEPALDETGLLTFLISGYCYLDRTLFKDVRYLTPASILHINLRSLKLSHERYWNLKYDSTSKADPLELSQRLNEAINDSIELFTPQGSHRQAGIFLSGGWDSKGILGAMHRLNRPPACVVTNGESDHLPYSDTFIAKQIANKSGIPCRLNIKNPQVAEEIIQDGINSCELITDTSPEVFGQHRIAGPVFNGLDFIFKGDEVWGWQDYAFNRQQAVGHVMANRISKSIGALLSPALASTASEIYNNEIDRIWQQCENENWNNRKDYLYLYGRVNRYIFGLGASDEEHLQVRRPYLTLKVLDVMADTPPDLRVQKNLFKQMMVAYHPSFVAFGDSYTSSIPDYYYHMRDQIIRQASEAIDAGMDFGGLINPEAALALIQSFSPQLTTKTAPTLKTRLRKRAENRWMHMIHRTRYYHRKVAPVWEDKRTTDDRIVFRLWLMSRWFGA